MPLIIILFSLFLASCSLISSDSPAGTQSGSVGTYRATLDEEERVALAKKRRSYITGIRKGDFYSLRNAPEEALSYYLQIQEKLPNDQVVRKKTAHVYFVLKNWSRAYQEYIKVPLSELLPEEKDELIHALFFDEDFYDRLGELQKLQITEDERVYYEVVDVCYSGVHNCIVTLESYTGSESRIVDLKNQIAAAKKITSDYQYRNLLVAGKFYEHGMYRATEILLQEILRNRPDYIEIKKMLGFALSELGQYESAKKSLLDYLERNPKDLESIVALGEIHAALGDYISSNLYLNNAIIAGYSPKIDIERRLAYNYNLLDDTVGMMKVLNYLLDSSEATEEDFAVGISVALNEGDLTRARSWAEKGNARFENSNFILPLYIQTLRLQGDLDSASALIQNTSEESMIQNPNFLLERAIIAFDLGDVEGAKKQFQDLMALKDWPEITQEAREYFSRISTP